MTSNKQHEMKAKNYLWLFLVGYLLISLLINAIGPSLKQNYYYKWGEAKKYLLNIYDPANPLIPRIDAMNYNPNGNYNIFLDSNVYSSRNTNSLPPYYRVIKSNSYWNAFAVGNLDGDAFLDIWMISSDGNLIHLQNDYQDYKSDLPFGINLQHLSFSCGNREK